MRRTPSALHGIRRSRGPVESRHTKAARQGDRALWRIGRVRVTLLARRLAHQQYIAVLTLGAEATVAIVAGSKATARAPSKWGIGNRLAATDSLVHLHRKPQ